MINKILFLVLLTLSPLVANAGNLFSNWFEVGLSKLDRPLISTLDMYRTEGLVLIDSDSDYAAFSGNASRLTAEQLKSVGLVEAEKSLVLKFNSCQGQGPMQGLINAVSVKIKIEDYPKIAQEVIDTIVYLDNNKQYTKGTFGKSKNVNNQIFMSWKKNDGTIVELQMNQNPPHQLVAVASKSCK